MTYQSKDRDEDALRHDIIKLAKMYGRYGYRKIVQLLRISGRKVNIRKSNEFGVKSGCNCQSAINANVGFIIKIAPSSVCVPMGLTMCGPSI